MKRNYFTFSSDKSNRKEQIEDCIQAYKSFTAAMRSPLALRCTFFIDAKDNIEYEHDKHMIHAMTEDVFSCPAVIGQPPIHAGMALECVIIDRSELNANVALRSVNGHPYIVLEKGNDKKLYASGICGGFGSSIKEQSLHAFELAQSILRKEDLEFSDIIRQWNYVENITQTVQQDAETFQHYQIFNDVRSMYYAKAEFNHGYPAATGIGMDTGGIILEIIAGKGDSFKIIPIDNPEQISAHKYSERVLVGKEIEEFEQKSTPKFERAKYIESGFGKVLFISGTAAIRGEQTIPSECIHEQTQITLENIQKLNYNGSHEHGYSMYRLYVKDPAQGKEGYENARNFFGDIPSLALKGPVCRDNLVVEIEAEKAF